MSFKNLAHFDPSGRTAMYEFPVELPGNPRLKLKHAGRTNRSYTKAILNANAKSGQKRRAVTIEAMEDGLQLDVDLFPKHVIVGWENVKNDKGKDVPFSVKECAEFLAALPVWLMQHLSTWAAQEINFLPDDEPTDEEVAEQAGN